MKYSSGSLFAMLAITSMLAGCASTGTTPASSTAAEATPTTQAPTSESTTPAKKGGDPECE